MAYVTPKESWEVGNAPLPADFNRIEGNTRANHEGIGIEAMARLDADNLEITQRNIAIEGAITGESAIRLAADNAEAQARYNADVAEYNARIAADNLEISARNTAIAAEALARSNADSAEALTRGNADTAETNARVAAVNAEALTRSNADAAIAAGAFVIENRTSDPTSPAVGHMWIRIDL